MRIISNGFLHFLQNQEKNRKYVLQASVHHTKKKLDTEKNRLKT